LNRKYGKWTLLNGRWVPIFAGGAPDDGGNDSGNGSDNTNSGNANAGSSDNSQGIDIEKAKEEAVQEFVKQFGFEKPEQIKELMEKAKQAEEKTTTVEQLQSELQNFKKAYEMEKVSNAVLSEANKMGVIDPELVMLMAKEKAEVKDGKVLVNGKPVEEFLKELKEKKPHLFKATEGEGSGTTPQKPQNTENLPKEERLKLGLSKKFGGNK